MEEEEDLKSKKSKPICGNIDDLSIEDLEEVIQDLNNEIVRIETLIKKKKKAKKSAEKLFK